MTPSVPPRLPESLDKALRGIESVAPARERLSAGALRRGVDAREAVTVVQHRMNEECKVVTGAMDAFAATVRERSTTLSRQSAALPRSPWFLVHALRNGVTYVFLQFWLLFLYLIVKIIVAGVFIGGLAIVGHMLGILK